MKNEYTVAVDISRPSNLILHGTIDGELLVSWSYHDNIGIRWINDLGIPQSDIINVYKKKEEVSAKTFWPKDRGYSMEILEFDIVQLDADTRLLCALRKGTDYSLDFIYINNQEKNIIEIKSLDIEAYLVENLSCASDMKGEYVASWIENETDIVITKKKDANKKISRTLTFDDPVHGLSVITTPEGLVTVYVKSTPGGIFLMSDVFDKDFTLIGRNKLDNLFIEKAFPFLLNHADGIYLAFRDDKDKDGQYEFYFTTISLKGYLRNRPNRISRADGPLGPVLSADEGLIYSAQIRSYQSNLLVGLNRFNSWGQKQGAEYQVYADKSDFTRASVKATRGKLVLVYAEEKDNSGRVLAAQVKCADRR